MSIILRRALFYLLLSVFLVASPLVIAYSSGWRLNTKTWEFQQTGAIFLEGFPQNAKFFLDSQELDSKKRLFQKGLLIDNLLPGSYKVEIIDSNKNSWQKTFTVKSTLVRSIKSILIPPQEQSSTKIWNEPVKDIFFTDFLEINGLLWISEKNEIFFSTNEKPIIGNKINAVSYDGTKVVTSKNNTSFFVTNLQAPESALSLNTLTRQLGSTSTILNVIPHPYNNFRWIIHLKNGLFVVDTQSLSLEKIGNTTSNKILEKNNKLFWSDKNTSTETIVEYDPLIKKTEAILENEKGTIKDLDVTDSKIIILKENGELYSFDKNTKKETLIASSTESFIIAPNNKKIAIKTKDSILIYFLEDTDGDEKHISGDATILNNLNFTKSDFVKLAWHKDSSHLFIEANRNLLFTETDDYQPQNYWTVLSQIKTSFYDEKENTLYFIKNNALYKLEFIRS